MQSAKLPRTLFWAVWFVLVPAVLAALAVWALKPSSPEAAAEGFGKLRWLVQDQPVPSGIVLFTVFEMLLYHFRYYLPLAAEVGLGGRKDVPPELRRDYEQASHLVDEAERIRDKNAKAVARAVPKSARDELDEALEELRETLDAKEFVADDFEAAYENL